MNERQKLQGEKVSPTLFYPAIKTIKKKNPFYFETSENQCTFHIYPTYKNSFRYESHRGGVITIVAGRSVRPRREHEAVPYFESRDLPVKKKEKEKSLVNIYVHINVDRIFFFGLTNLLISVCKCLVITFSG